MQGIYYCGISSRSEGGRHERLRFSACKQSGAMGLREKAYFYLDFSYCSIISTINSRIPFYNRFSNNFLLKRGKGIKDVLLFKTFFS